MALPSASLGSMASLNMPTSVPTVVVPGKEEYWKKALLGLLVNAAGSVAQQGVKNSMSQDYAAQYGETPKTGFDKAWSGPAVNENEHGRRQDTARQIGLIELADKPGAKDQIARSERELDRLNSSNNAITNQRMQLLGERRADDRTTAQIAAGDRQLGTRIEADKATAATRAAEEKDMRNAMLRQLEQTIRKTDADMRFDAALRDPMMNRGQKPTVPASESVRGIPSQLANPTNNPRVAAENDRRLQEPQSQLQREIAQLVARAAAVEAAPDTAPGPVGSYGQGAPMRTFQTPESQAATLAQILQQKAQKEDALRALQALLTGRPEGINEAGGPID